MIILRNTTFSSFFMLLSIANSYADDVLKKSRSSKVLLMSLGGFRLDYITKLNLPNINYMISSGSKVQYVENAVNTLDIVDHISVITGLYPESHGIISNTMYDPVLNRVFNQKTRDQPDWWKHVHPIWEDVERQRLGSSAVCQWPGTYGVMNPALHCGTPKNLTKDINQVINWLRDDVKLVLLYTDVIKQAALRWGPFSPETITEVQNVDAIIKYLRQETRDLNLDILLMSDGGVAELNNHVVNLDECLHPASYVLPQSQGTLFFYPKRGHTVAEIHQNLTHCRHLKVYLKEELPKRFHFTNNPRIPPIVAFVSLGTRVRSSKIRGSQMYKNGGVGYHPGYKVMRGMLIGYGPSFSKGIKFHAIRNVDIYPLMCQLLRMIPRSHNGSREVISMMINEDTSLTSHHITLNSMTTTTAFSRQLWIKEEVKWLFWILVAITGLLTAFCCLGCIATMFMNHRHGEYHKTKVAEPAMTSLLTDDSSVEE